MALKKTAEAAQEIWKWILANELEYDAKLYSTEEWKKKGERWGNNALFTIVTEGPHYELVNSYMDSSSERKLTSQLDKLMKKLGIYYELGFAWSMHFYSVEAPARSGIVVPSALRLRGKRRVRRD